MPGPIIKIPVDAEGLARIGNYKAAAKAARIEVKALEREAKSTAATMGSIPASLQTELNAAQARQEDFSKRAKEVVSPHQMERDVHMYSRLAKAQMVKNLMTGEGGIQDVLQLAHSRTLRRMAAKVGLGGVAESLTAMAPAAAVGLIVYESIKHIAEAVKKQNEGAAEIGRKYGGGGIEPPFHPLRQ